MRQRIRQWSIERMEGLWDFFIYGFVDGIAVVAASIDFLTDMACSRGHPKASWLKYIQSGRGQLGWFVWTIQLRNKMKKTNPSMKFFCFMGGQDMFGNADEMTPDLRQAVRNGKEILKKLEEPNQKNDIK